MESLAEVDGGIVGVLTGDRQIKGFKGAEGNFESHEKEEGGWGGQEVIGN